MKLKMRKTLKKVGLGCLAVASIGAAAFTAVKIGETLQNDTIKVGLNYNVGGLDDTTGKYVKDESRIYTKDRFACYGLNTKLEFDSTISYQVFYYDINDNFISASEVLTFGITSVVPRNGAYARIEITPLDDEDGKITRLEKREYSSQLSVRVAKDAKSMIDERYTSFKGHVLEVVEGFDDCTIGHNYNWSSSGLIAAGAGAYSIEKEIVNVGKNNVLSCDLSKFTFSAEDEYIKVTIIEFSDLPTKVGVLKERTEFCTQARGIVDLNLEKSAKYILVSLTSTVDENTSIGTHFKEALTLKKI